MIDTLILIEQPSDIASLQSRIGDGNHLFYSFDEELRVQLEDSGLATFRLADRRELSRALLKGIDDFAIRLAENWYKEAWIYPYQQYRSIDTAGIFTRDLIYYLIGLVKKTLLLTEAIRKTSPKKVCYGVTRQSNSSSDILCDERIAHRIVPFCRDILKSDSDIELIATVVDNVSKPQQPTGGIRSWIRSFIGKHLGRDLAKESSSRQRPAILFSSDLRHVLGVMELFRGGPYRLLYLRPEHGIHNYLSLRGWGVELVRLSEKAEEGRLEVSLLKKTLEEVKVSQVSETPSLYTFQGMNFFPLFQMKMKAALPQLLSRELATIDILNRVFSREEIRMVVTEEDVCPFNKRLAQMASRHGIPTVAIQHGGMGHAKAFIPLSSEFFFCWGENDRQRLMEWGVPAEKIRVTGSACYEGLMKKKSKGYSSRRGGSRRVLYLGVPYHERHRPDFVDHGYISWASHQEELKVLKELIREYPNVRFVYKFHPRDLHTDETMKSLMAEAKLGRVTFVKKGYLGRLFDEADFVVTAWSSVCIEALLLEKPLLVVNLESAYDAFPMLQEEIALGAKTEEEFKNRFREMLAKTDQELFEWKERIRCYASRLNQTTPSGATKQIFQELRKILETPRKTAVSGPLAKEALAS